MIIPCFHDWEGARLCLDCITRQKYPRERFEVLLVNNDPQDLPPEDFQLPSNCVLLEESGSGSYAARNRALRNAKGSILAFTDADCLPLEDWISNAVNIFQANEGVSRIGGAVEVFCKAGSIPDIALPYERLFALEQREFVKRGTAITANLFVRKSVFDEVGEFDETLKSGGDAEWGMRAHFAGSRITYSEQVKVRHPARTLGEVIVKNRRLAGGAFDIARKRSKVAVAKLFVLTLSPPIFAMYRAWKASELTMGEKLKAVLIRMLLRMLAIVELLRLAMGKKSERQ